MIMTRHVGGEFVVESENIQCGYGGVTCTKAVSIFVNGTAVELVMGKLPSVDGQELTSRQLVDFRFNGGRLVYNGLNTVVFFDGGLNVVWNGGSSLSFTPVLSCIPANRRNRVLFLVKNLSVCVCP